MREQGDTGREKINKGQEGQGDKKAEGLIMKTWRQGNWRLLIKAIPPAHEFSWLPAGVKS